MPQSVVASAPSQAFLFGEHAVLYKKPALAVGVDRRAYIEASLANRGELLLSSTAYTGTYGGRVEGGELEGEGDPDLEKLAEGMAILLSSLGEQSGVKVHIDSEIPVGSGMASSASVGAAISKTIATLFGRELSEEELLDAVYAFEKKIHGRASKTGPACAAFGGLIWVEWEGDEMTVSRLSAERQLPLVMACTGESTRTREMIAIVAHLYEQEREISSGLLSAIEEVTVRGRESVMKGDLEAAGRLMNLNHGLLSALGVSSPGLERAVWIARASGSLGAKLSGGGGGGCIIALSEEPERLVSNLKSGGLNAFIAPIASEGVRVESVRE